MTGEQRQDRREAQVRAVERLGDVRAAWWGAATGRVWALGEREGTWYLLELADDGVLEVVSCAS